MIKRSASPRLIGLSLGVSLLLGVNSALAAPSLTFSVTDISAGSTGTITVNDGDLKDSQNLSNNVGFNGILGFDGLGNLTDDTSAGGFVGLWRINTETLLQFDGSNNALAFEAFNVSRLGGIGIGDVLEVTATASGFTSPDGLVFAFTDITPSNNDPGATTDFESTVDGNPILSATGILTGGALSNTEQVTVSAPFDITHVVTHTATALFDSTTPPGFSEATTFDADTRVIPVPLPPTLSLLGIGLIGLGFLSRRREAVA